MINNKSYIGLIVVVVVFSLIFIPRIFERLKKVEIIFEIFEVLSPAAISWSDNIEISSFDILFSLLLFI